MDKVKPTDWKNRISIHILTRERHSYLALLLESLLRQTFTNWDLFILDNNDEPYYIENNHLISTILQRMINKKHQVAILRPKNSSTKKDIGVSRNLLIEGDNLNELCCRIDDDSIIEPDYLERLHKAIMTDEKIAAVGGVVPGYINEYYKYPPKHFNPIRKAKVPEKYLELSKKYPEILNGFDEEYYDIGEPVDDGGYLYHKDYEGLIPTTHIRSSFLFRKSAMKEAGMHPSSDDTGFREETIISLKLLDKGWKLVTDPLAICWHLWCPNLGRATDREVHERKILRNEINFQKTYVNLLRRFAQ